MHTSLSRGSVVAVCQKAEPGLPKLMVDAAQLIENYGKTCYTDHNQTARGYC